MVDWTSTQHVHRALERSSKHTRFRAVEAISSRETTILQQRRSRPPGLIRVLLIGSIPTAFLLMAVLPALLGDDAVAAPGVTSADHALNQNVSYLSPENAAGLNLDFPVLVPSDVPAPFSGEPAVDAGDGSYSLYWIVTGGAPTFLQVTGTVGGALPAGSPADLNNELSVNASVGGNDAINDVTDTYDAVWWVSGGVLYSVESRNMSTDSLSLANSLIQYVGPEAPEPVEDLPPDAGGGILETPTNPPDLPDEGTDPDVDGDVEPVATSEATEASTGDGDGETDLTVEAAAQPTAQVGQPEEGSTAETPPEPSLEPAEALAGETPEPVIDSPVEGQEGLTPEPTDDSAQADPTTDASGGMSTSGSNALSDGTGGASLPVFGGDGTGGTRDLIVVEPDE